ncbi:MAG: right-handed parallel beta-helix repeat-containing protein [Kiritimatiellae bacterium]|nr:right-handed parallel beta-helix repeat-containing protein [Kiritimatiellia bacterium]
MRGSVIPFLIITLHASATTYHVATNGSDRNDGSATRPFRTIQEAANAVAPGDVVRVEAGVYHETVTMKHSGMAGKPIVFEGDRGRNGEWKTIIDPSEPVSGWAPAPEIGFGVYKKKTSDIGYEPHGMVTGEKHRTVPRICPGHMPKKGIKSLAISPTNTVSCFDGKLDVNYWDAAEAMYGSLDGITYLRFRDGADPNTLRVRTAPARAGVLIKDKGHIVVRGFLIRGAACSVEIAGQGAGHNVVERNHLMNGRSQVSVSDGAFGNHVRDNTMTLAPLSACAPGPWGNYWKNPPHHYGVRAEMYRQYKYLFGRSTSMSGEWSVRVERAGTDNEVYRNHIFEGDIGIFLWHVPDVRVHANRVHNMHSVGVVIGGGVSGELYDNAVYECNINLRPHTLRDQRVYVYRNRFWNTTGVGKNTHFHWNPAEESATQSFAQIHLYHNTFCGAQYAIAINAAGAKSGGLPTSLFLNNVFSSPSCFQLDKAFWENRNMIGAWDYNWVGGKCRFGIPPWFGSHNVLADGRKMWDDKTMPDFRLPADSPARNAGLDLSKPFTIDGKTYDPLPGMKPGCFSGSAPDLGAVQDGRADTLPPGP